MASQDMAKPKPWSPRRYLLGTVLEELATIKSNLAAVDARVGGMEHGLGDIQAHFQAHENQLNYAVSLQEAAERCLRQAEPPPGVAGDGAATATEMAFERRILSGVADLIKPLHTALAEVQAEQAALAARVAELHGGVESFGLSQSNIPASVEAVLTTRLATLQGGVESLGLTQSDVAASVEAARADLATVARDVLALKAQEEVLLGDVAEPRLAAIQQQLEGVTRDLSGLRGAEDAVALRAGQTLEAVVEQLAELRSQGIDSPRLDVLDALGVQMAGLVEGLASLKSLEAALPVLSRMEERLAAMGEVQTAGRVEGQLDAIRDELASFVVETEKLAGLDIGPLRQAAEDLAAARAALDASGLRVQTENVVLEFRSVAADMVGAIGHRLGDVERALISGVTSIGANVQALRAEHRAFQQSRD